MQDTINKEITEAEARLKELVRMGTHAGENFRLPMAVLGRDGKYLKFDKANKAIKRVGIESATVLKPEKALTLSEAMRSDKGQYPYVISYDVALIESIDEVKKRLEFLKGIPPEVVDALGDVLEAVSDTDSDEAVAFKAFSEAMDRLKDILENRESAE